MPSNSEIIRGCAQSSANIKARVAMSTSAMLRAAMGVDVGGSTTLSVSVGLAIALDASGVSDGGLDGCIVMLPKNVLYLIV